MREYASLSPSGDYIVIISDDKFGLTEMQSAIDQALVLHETKGVDRVLVDSTACSHAPTREDATAGALFLSEKTRSKLRFAVVVREIKGMHMEFALSVGVQFGLIRYFIDLNQAKTWLLQT